MLKVFYKERLALMITAKTSPLFSIQEGFSKGVIFDLQSSNLHENRKSKRKSKPWSVRMICMCKSWCMKSDCTSSFWYAVTAMNWVSLKETLETRRWRDPTHTMWSCGSYLWREFNMIWRQDTFINGLLLVRMPVCTCFYPCIPVVILR